MLELVGRAVILAGFLRRAECQMGRSSDFQSTLAKRIRH